MHVVGTAGHVDHGKSALIRALTGTDPDRFAEEKERGLTIDLGFAWLELPSGNEIGLIDVPGHERFIRNMLAGAGGITVGLFVVAANEGWKPQSSEHLAIIDTLGITSGVVALTKSDVADTAALDAVRDEVHDRTRGTVVENYPIVACSSVTGAGLDELVATLDDVVTSTPPAPDDGKARMWVDRVFTVAGAGTVVTGTLAGGRLAVGDAIEIAPEGRAARIRSIQSHKKEVASIGPGNRVALNLAGLERKGAQRGDAIVAPASFRITDTIDVSLSALPGGRGLQTDGITDRGAHLLYLGSAEVAVRVRPIGTDVIKPGETGFAQLSLQRGLPIRRGDRFVLRDVGRVATIGGGAVIDPLPDIYRRSDDSRAHLLAAMDGEAPLEALVEVYGSLDRDDALYRTGTATIPDIVVDRGDRLLSRNAAAEQDVATEREMTKLDARATELLERLRSSGLTPPMTKELGSDPVVVRSLASSGHIVRIGDFYLARESADDAVARVRALIETEGPVAVAQIRDALGITRKYAVPLCEWLDSTGVTERAGDLRVLR